MEAIGRFAGPALCALILLLPAPAGLNAPAQRLAALVALMAVYWLTQAIPIAVTSLVPLVGFPLLGIMTSKQSSAFYMDPNILLYLGGFVIALGIEKWGLHRRMALHIVALLGTGPRRVVLGFMVATGFLSMWISNTAATLLMLPIGLALVASLEELCRQSSNAMPANAMKDDQQTGRALSRLSVAVMLGIAYGASIGGLTTLVGTPTNVQFRAIFENRFPEAPAIAAGVWTTTFLPVGIVMMLLTWAVLACRLPPIPGMESVGRDYFNDRIRAIGRIGRAEVRMLMVFAATALLWILRKPLEFTPGDALLPGWSSLVESMLLALGATTEFSRNAVDDSTVAIGMALLMFLIPAGRDDVGRTQFLMDWQTAEKKLPWGILLLFGGGFAIAGAFQQTGLAEWIGSQFAGQIAGWPVWMMVAAVCLLLTFMTEFTSNVATVSAILPILASVAVSVKVDPLLLLVPAAISASCAFMLPIGTPPNAIVFGSGRVDMGQMARHGVALNFVGVIVVTVATFWFVVPRFGIEVGSLPAWAAP